MTMNLVSIGVIGAVYVIPKIVTYLCTEPPSDRQSRIDNVRRYFFQQQLALKAYVGNETWFIATDMVADNAWISAIAITCLLNGQPLLGNVEHVANVIVGFFAFCSLSFVARFGVSKAIPSLARFVGTRSIT